MRLRLSIARVLAALTLAAPLPLLAQAGPAGHRALRREILEELVEINTSNTDSTRRTGEAAQAAARRLVAAGFPAADVRVVEVTPGYHSLVARYRGRPGAAAKPILLMAHMDVVDARREDWSFEPFEFREVDGWYYGRGVLDNKAGVATLVANFIRWRQEGWVPVRDLILVATADEETSGDAMRGLVEKHRALVDAEYALNADAGGGELRDGKPVAFLVQTAEKVYATLALEVKSKGGHSSVPVADNAITRLGAGLVRLGRWTFPVRLNETTRTFFQRVAPRQPAAIARDMRRLSATSSRAGDTAAARRLSAASPTYNATLRTTCVATRLAAGHADNALPQSAKATVNCRLMPDHPIDSVEATLRRVLADTGIAITRQEVLPAGPVSPLRPDVMRPVERLVAEMWPGAVIVPEMSTGATDGLFTRSAGIPTYGLSAVFDVIDDVRAHGRDERIGVKAFHDAAEFWYRLVKELGSSR